MAIFMTGTRQLSAPTGMNPVTGGSNSLRPLWALSER